jgi:hypothetical protein
MTYLLPLFSILEVFDRVNRYILKIIIPFCVLILQKAIGPSRSSKKNKRVGNQGSKIEGTLSIPNLAQIVVRCR